MYSIAPIIWSVANKSHNLTVPRHHHLLDTSETQVIEKFRRPRSAAPYSASQRREIARLDAADERQVALVDIHLQRNLRQVETCHTPSKSVGVVADIQH